MTAAAITTVTIPTTVRVTATFTSLAGDVLDPTTIRLVVREPDETETVAVYPASPIVREEDGVYHADVRINVVGTWRVGWQGEGAVDAPGVCTIIGRASGLDGFAGD